MLVPSQDVVDIMKQSQSCCDSIKEHLMNECEMSLTIPQWEEIDNIIISHFAVLAEKEAINMV